MRKVVAAVVLLGGLAAWITVGALTAPPERARAQSPAVEIHKTQHAEFSPTRNRPVVVMAIGSDARPGTPIDKGLSDSLHLITVNPAKGGATILGFPRDSIVNIPGAGERKINDSMFFGGPQLTVKTVENLTGIKVDYYLLTTFQGLTNMVNRIQGIKVKVPYGMHDPYSGTHFDKGLRKLNGADALSFSRDRHSTPNGDFSRSENQGRLIMAALKKLQQEFAHDPAVLFEWIVAGLANMKTDLPLGELFDLSLTSLNISPKKVTNCVVPGGTGTRGGASVVIISSSAQNIYRDMKDDGLVNRC